MTRDDIKKILGEGATEEQITNTLNALHNQTNALKQELETVKANQSKYSDYDDIKKQLDDINKANLTREEQMALKEKEIEEKLRSAKLTSSKAKVMEVLAGRDIDEELIDSIVGEDEAISIAKAQKLATKLDNLIAYTKKKTEEELANLNVKPNLPNTDPNTDGTMSWDKFSKLSVEEQNKFATEHPDEFANL